MHLIGSVRRSDVNVLELTATALGFVAICALEEAFAVAGVRGTL